jgi:hypothetical protein
VALLLLMIHAMKYVVMVKYLDCNGVMMGILNQEMAVLQIVI